MSNDYYSRTSNPQSNSAGSSSLIRAEFALLEAGFDKLPTLTANADEVVVVNSGATGMTSVTRSGLIDTTVVAATSKATPVDADLIPLVDSAASNVLKKLTWANLKATLLTWLQGTVFPSPGAIGGTTPSTGAFTTLSANGQITATTTGDAIRVSASGRNAYLACDSAGFTLVTGAGQTGSGIYAKASDNTLQLWANATAIATVSSAGVAVTGNTTSTKTGDAFVAKTSGTLSTTGVTYYAFQDTVERGYVGYGAGNGTIGLVNFVGNIVVSGSGVSSTFSSTGLAVTGTLSSTGTVQAATGTLGQAYVGLGTALTSGAGANDTSIRWDGVSGNLLFSANNAEVARLTASGNLGLGVTPSATGAGQKSLDVGSLATLTSNPGGNTSTSLTQNAYFNGTNWIYRNSSTGSALYQMTGASAGSTHTWSVSAGGTAGNAITFTQSMTLTAAGDLLVGTTTNTFGAAVGMRLGDSAGRLEIGSATSTNATVGFDMYSTGAGAYRFYVGWGGTIFATSATITAISDRRFKENIKDLDDGLSSVMALQPRSFDWKAGKGKDIKGDRGFIAQEFEQVFPDLIDEWKDPAPEGEEPYKAVRADLIPVLVKAIQEQQALITSLTARVAQLEGI